MTNEKRPFIAADAVKAITLDWAKFIWNNKNPFYHDELFSDPNKWREIYELPRLIVVSGDIVEEYK
jgi:hypothetical protein